MITIQDVSKLYKATTATTKARPVLRVLLESCLAPKEFSAYSLLKVNEGISPDEVAGQIGTTAGNASRTLKALYDYGLARRERGKKKAYIYYRL